jgi:hypothetical protein
LFLDLYLFSDIEVIIGNVETTGFHPIELF